MNIWKPKAQRQRMGCYLDKMSCCIDWCPYFSLFLLYSGLEIKLNLETHTIVGDSLLLNILTRSWWRKINVKWLIRSERNNYIHCYRECHVRSQIIVKICWVTMKLESGELVAIFLWPRLLSHEQNATFPTLGHICYIEPVILFMELCWHFNNCLLGLFFLFVHSREIHFLIIQCHNMYVNSYKLRV